MGAPRNKGVPPSIYLSAAWESNPPPHCSILLSGSAQVFLACLSTHELEAARDWTSKLWGYTEMTTEAAAVFHAPPQGAAVQSSKDWIPLD